MYCVEGAGFLSACFPHPFTLVQPGCLQLPLVHSLQLVCVFVPLALSLWQTAQFLKHWESIRRACTGCTPCPLLD